MRSKVICWVASGMAVVAINAVAGDSTEVRKIGVKPGDKISILTLDKMNRRQVGYFRGHEGANLYYAPQGTYVIERAITYSGDTIDFPFTGAIYDSVADSISGIDSGGGNVTLALRDVQSVGVQYAAEGGDVHTNFSPVMVRRRLGAGTAYPEVVTVPVDSIQSLKVWRTATTELLIGMAVGGLIGYGIGTTAEDDPNDWDHLIFQFDKGTKMVFDIALGALIGASVGYMMGGRNGWRDVDLQKPKLAIVPQLTGRPGLAAAVRF